MSILEHHAVKRTDICLSSPVNVSSMASVLVKGWVMTWVDDSASVTGPTSVSFKIDEAEHETLAILALSAAFSALQRSFSETSTAISFRTLSSSVTKPVFSALQRSFSAARKFFSLRTLSSSVFKSVLSVLSCTMVAEDSTDRPSYFCCAALAAASAASSFCCRS